jgi:adenosine deaminase
MVEANIIRNFLLDSESLATYLQGKLVSIGDIRRRLLLSERENDSRIPDQFYRLALDRDLKNVKTIEDIFCHLLPSVAKEYLSIDRSDILVSDNNQNDWQEFITFIPPLLLKMAFLHLEQPLSKIDEKTIKNYFHSYILPNSLYTSIPSPKNEVLKEIIENEKGLHDLHMHLNGSTEIDIAWQDLLFHPHKIYKELKIGFSNELVKEQVEVESNLLDPLKFYNLLSIAGRLRSILYDLIFSTALTPKYPPLKNLLLQTLYKKGFTERMPVHPFQTLVNSYGNKASLMAVEGLMYSIVLHKIADRKNATMATFFHFYLLIQGLANRLLVQQVHQKGFEQFQKITVNRIREFSEMKYEKRFFQMHGNQLKFLSFLEGRFSPKKSEIENVEFINKIMDGWKKFCNELENKDLNIPELRLIPHFIKKKDSKPHKYIRYKHLREDTWKKGKVLSLLIKDHKRYAKLLTGVDAASSEFDTPPEVFAPTFRALRRKETFHHFTYHVGEDFFHITSGIRAIYEAINFLGLQSGDRIGHGTATAICVNTWKAVVGETILIKKGEWLDNLIFIHHFSSTLEKFVDKLKNIEIVISRLTNEIYKPSFPFTVSEIVRAWQLRKYCPILVFSSSHSIANTRSTYDLQEWEDIQNENITLNEKRILELYHTNEFTAEYETVIPLKVDGLLNLSELEELQKLILKELKEKQIVIETLPTSNVRIGYNKNYKSYHLNNWVNWQKEGKDIPKIVVGTDDTGIFATNIFNEYANIWDYLVKSEKHTQVEIKAIIEDFINNGKTYSFT